jgi:hypothetical protein
MAQNAKSPDSVYWRGFKGISGRVRPSRAAPELSLYRPASALFRFRYYDD